MPMQVRCPVCHEVLGGYVPKGGDGSALVLYRHKVWSVGRRGKNHGYVWCEGSRKIGSNPDAPRAP